MKLNIQFKDEIKEYIICNNLFAKRFNSKYTLDEILNVIEYVLVTGASWRSLNLPIFDGKYKWQSIYYHFNKWVNLNVFKKVYLLILKKYIKTNISNKLKYLSVDSSFIKNEYASKNVVGFNGHCKKKRYSKLSLIVDSNGVTLSALLRSGNLSDQTLMMSNLDDMFVIINYVSKNNKHKRYILGDSIYDTKEIKSKMTDIGIKPIISFNRRNTKDSEIIKKAKFNKREKEIYKKRIIIENVFSWLFKNRRISRRYDKNNKTYMSFLFIALTKILIKRL